VQGCLGSLAFFCYSRSQPLQREGMTFEDILEKNNNTGPGFNFLRLALSITILWVHSFIIPTGENSVFWDTPVGRLSMCLVPAFFALSGFLVMGSVLRTGSLAKFLSFRVLRIVPALSAEVILTAMVVGPLATSLPFADYMQHEDVLLYFTNIVGWTHYLLPGVFTDQPFQWVNGSLWTIQPEIFCYLWLSFLIMFGACRNARLYLSLAVLLITANAYIDWAVKPAPHPTIGPLFQFRLFTYFVAGGALYHYRNRVRYSAVMFALGVIIAGFIDKYTRMADASYFAYCLRNDLSGPFEFTFASHFCQWRLFIWDILVRLSDPTASFNVVARISRLVLEYVVFSATNLLRCMAILDSNREACSPAQTRRKPLAEFRPSRK
jgi:peptidoglycan/LPS O-acetylase OafA/YrhL